MRAAAPPPAARLRATVGDGPMLGVISVSWESWCTDRFPRLGQRAQTDAAMRRRAKANLTNDSEEVVTKSKPPNSGPPPTAPITYSSSILFRMTKRGGVVWEVCRHTKAAKKLSEPSMVEDKRATTNVQNRFVQFFLLSFLLFYYP